MSFFAISALINTLTSFIIGFFVIYKSRIKVNLIFSFFALSVGLWSLFYFLWQISDNSSGALLWTRLLTIGSIFIPIFYFHFTLTFLNLLDNVYNRILLIFGYIIGIILTFLVPTSLMVKGTENRLSFEFWPIPGFFYWVFLFMFSVLATYSVFLYIKEYRKIKGVKREQIKFLLLGTGIGFLGGATNFPLWYNVPMYPVGNILVSLYVIFTAYAIITHRLMDIKLVMRKSAVFVLSLVTILIPTVIAKYFIGKHFVILSGWFDIIILIVGISVYPFIKDFYFKSANKHFFSSLYDSGKVIADVSNQLRMIMDIGKVYDFIQETLSRTFHTKSFAVIAYNKNNQEYSIVYNDGFMAKKGDVFAGNNFLHRYFTEQNKAIVVEEVKNLYYNKKTKKTIDLLVKMNVNILAPLNVKNKTIGLLVLGAKESGDMYNEEDLQVLEIIGAQAAVSIENAQLYTEVKEFNNKLKGEIEKATTELKGTNAELKDMNEKLVTAYEKLHQLDRAKTEFISIASHQLRTPLTSIKGFISLLLDGTYGKIRKTTQEVLEKVFISNERLIKLVEDLLNISRIESGKLVFRFKKGDITKLAKDMVSSFELAAKNKKLKLEYRTPKKKIPEVYFDYDKMREIISNLIDNSIKYTKKGSVSVTVESDDKFVRVIVSDSGMGIVKEETRYIFEKFQRGKDSSTTHTEGVGLGLYVCEKMLSSHDGKIWAESEGLEKGSKFIVQLKKDFIPDEMIKTIGKEKR